MANPNKTDALRFPCYLYRVNRLDYCPECRATFTKIKTHLRSQKHLRIVRELNAGVMSGLMFDAIKKNVMEDYEEKRQALIKDEWSANRWGMENWEIICWCRLMHINTHKGVVKSKEELLEIRRKLQIYISLIKRLWLKKYYKRMYSLRVVEHIKILPVGFINGFEGGKAMLEEFEDFMNEF